MRTKRSAGSLEALQVLSGMNQVMMAIKPCQVGRGLLRSVGYGLHRVWAAASGQRMVLTSPKCAA